MAEVVFGDTHYNVLFLIGSLLFHLHFCLMHWQNSYFKNLVVKSIIKEIREEEKDKIS